MSVDALFDAVPATHPERIVIRRPDDCTCICGTAKC